MSQFEKQTIVMHTLSNIPRRKGNKKMKFGQLRETITRRPFYKKSKLKISLDQQFEVLCSLFLLYDKLKTSKRYRI